MEGCRWVTLLLLVVAVAKGAAGCGRSSTTTRAPPTVEPEIQAVTAPSNERTGGRGRQQGGGGSRSRSSTTSVMSATELRAATEELLTLDSGMPQPVISVQGQTSGSAVGDAAPRPLITSVQQAALTKETVRLMKELLDNYEPQVTRLEVQTNSERAEENRFLEALMQTPLMQRLETILQQKGVLQGRLRDTLKLIWFTPYKRGGRVSSSGFEHVFVGEVQNSKVSGFHNWLSFFKEEGEGDLDYKGYLKKLNFGSKGEIIKMRFVWLGDNKPVGTVFIGTTPELEMGLYTLCFLVMPNARCPVQLSGKKFTIQTYSQAYQGKTLVGSAYPEI